MSIIIAKGQYIVDNLGIINENMPEILRNVTDPHLKKYMRSYTQQKLKKYPPKPVHSSYVRTGELRRGWDTEVGIRRDWVAIVNKAEVNKIGYAKWVVGNEQVRFHGRTGWLRLPEHEQPVLKGAEPVVGNSLDSEIRKFLFSKGLL